MKRVTRQEVKKALEKNSKSKSYCKCAGCVAPRAGAWIETECNL